MNVLAIKKIKSKKLKFTKRKDKIKIHKSLSHENDVRH